MPLAPNFGPSLVISRRDTRVDVPVADIGHHARLNALGIIRFRTVTAISRRQAVARRSTARAPATSSAARSVPPTIHAYLCGDRAERRAGTAAVGARIAD